MLEGSIRRAADRLRVSVRLLEGETGRLISSERLEQLTADLLAVQEEVARRIAAGWRPRSTRSRCAGSSAFRFPN